MIMIFELVMNERAPSSPSVNKIPSTNEEPSAVANPCQNPYKELCLKVNIKIGPPMADTNNPTKKHCVKNDIIIFSP